MYNLRGLDEQLKYFIKDLWRTHWIKIPILIGSLLAGIYLAFIPMIQVVFRLYESRLHMAELVILTGVGCFLVVWTIRETYRLIKKK